MQNSIKWPEKWLPGTTDNFVSNEVIIKDLDFNKILNNLIDTSKWENYYSNSSDVITLNQKDTILHLGTEFSFKTFGFDIKAKVVECDIDRNNEIARIAWEAWNDGKESSYLIVYHAWIIEKISKDRIRILTQESQIGEPAKQLAIDKKFSMLNGHQEWLNGLVNYSK